MPDPIHDQAEDGFHEIQLSGKQLVFLFMLTTVVLVVTFLSGVLVGRAVGTEDQLPEEAVVTTESVDPIPAPEPTPPDDFKAHNSLKNKAAATDTPAPRDSTPPPPPPDPVPETSEPEQKPEPKPEPKVEPQKPESKPAAGVPTSGRPGTWFLQLSALRNRDAAADMVRELAAKGYPAYLQEPQGDALYRVRIGRYRDRAGAESVAARLKRQENVAADVRRN